jgi:hypothetical protein
LLQLVQAEVTPFLSFEAAREPGVRLFAARPSFGSGLVMFYGLR